MCAFSAGETFAAGFILQKIHKIFGDVNHAGIFIHNNHAARTHNRAGIGQAFVINGQIKHIGRNTSPGRSACLNRLYLSLAYRAATDIVDNFLDSHSHWYFDKAGILDFANQTEYLRAAIAWGTYIRKLLGSKSEDKRNVRPGLNVVNRCRFAINTFLHRERRSLARLTHLSFNRAYQRSLFTAHKCACSLDQLDIK